MGVWLKFQDPRLAWTNSLRASLFSLESPIQPLSQIKHPLPTIVKPEWLYLPISEKDPFPPRKHTTFAN